MGRRPGHSGRLSSTSRFAGVDVIALRTEGRRVTGVSAASTTWARRKAAAGYGQDLDAGSCVVVACGVFGAFVLESFQVGGSGGDDRAWGPAGGDFDAVKERDVVVTAVRRLVVGGASSGGLGTGDRSTVTAMVFDAPHTEHVTPSVLIASHRPQRQTSLMAWSGRRDGRAVCRRVAGLYRWPGGLRWRRRNVALCPSGCLAGRAGMAVHGRWSRLGRRAGSS